MRDAHATRRRRKPSPSFAMNVLGLFGLFGKKTSEAPAPRVEIVAAASPPPPSAPAAAATTPTIRDSVRFKGLHEDVNPSASVRPSEMTCVSCSRHFRYFVNANGAKTVCSCPGCGRQYRV